MILVVVEITENSKRWGFGQLFQATFSKSSLSQMMTTMEKSDDERSIVSKGEAQEEKYLNERCGQAMMMVGPVPASVSSASVPRIMPSEKADDWLTSSDCSRFGTVPASKTRGALCRL